MCLGRGGGGCKGRSAVPAQHDQGKHSPPGVPEAPSQDGEQLPQATYHTSYI